MIPLITITRPPKTQPEESGSDQLQPDETVNEQSQFKKKVEIQVDATGLRKILDDQMTRDHKFFVISLAGTKRSGKSFLANLLISYLTFLSKVS